MRINRIIVNFRMLLNNLVYTQGSLSYFEKEPWLRLVTWKCVSISCTEEVGPPLNFVDWTMKNYLGSGENSFLKMALEFLSWVQTVLLSASYDNIIVKAKQDIV